MRGGEEREVGREREEEGEGERAVVLLSITTSKTLLSSSDCV